MKKLRAGMDNYCLFPMNLLPLEMIRWAFENGAEGVAFSGYDEETRNLFTSSYLRDVKQLADDLGMYIEWGNGQHVPMDLNTFRPKEIFVSNRRAVGEACGLGINIVRSCSGGLMRWKKNAPSTDILLRETAKELRKQASMFRDNGIILAIETHFEFTTFELLRLFEMCETEPGDYLGICLDTMNLLTMLEEPVAATQRVTPWVVSTHIKDGGILHDKKGITTFPAPIGKGIVRIAEIIAKIISSGKEINFSAECHGGTFHLPVNEKWFIESFPDLSGGEYRDLLGLSEVTLEKMNDKLLSVTDRSEWPSICEERTRNDIKALKGLIDRIILPDASEIQV